MRCASSTSLANSRLISFTCRYLGYMKKQSNCKPKYHLSQGFDSSEQLSLIAKQVISTTDE